MSKDVFDLLLVENQKYRKYWTQKNIYILELLPSKLLWISYIHPGSHPWPGDQTPNQDGGQTPEQDRGQTPKQDGDWTPYKDGVQTP